MIASRALSYGQIVLNRTEALNVAEFTLDCQILEIENENYRLWVINQEDKIESIMLSNNRLELNIMELTKKLNDEQHKRLKARKSRVWWGIGGVLVGFIIYDYMK
jgi:hypothetical protein